VPFVRADPAEAGFSPERLTRIAGFLAAEIDRDRMPGAVVGIVRGGRLVYLEALGYRDKAKGIRMTADSLFWIASMTKPLTAATALTLVEREAWSSTPRSVSTCRSSLTCASRT
jgi:CubicO group peptidase (beta-lactamase class C family)